MMAPGDHELQWLGQCKRVCISVDMNLNPDSMPLVVLQSAAKGIKHVLCIGSRLIEAGTGFPSAGALVVPLIAKHEQLVIDWEALSFASKRPAVLDVPVPDLEVSCKTRCHLSCYPSYPHDGECPPSP